MQKGMLGLMLCAAFAANAAPVADKAKEDKLVFMRSEEPAMKRAFETGRATLDGFLRKASAPEQGTSKYALKVALSEGQNTEFFWVRDFQWADGQFTGTLANEPRMVKKYTSGQRIKFGRELVVDWTYWDAAQRRTFGNFTACALLTKEPPEEARKFKSQLGLQCGDE
jgi:uncharacterized protein YegJ (DUF2314 family)